MRKGNPKQLEIGDPTLCQTCRSVLEAGPVVHVMFTYRPSNSPGCFATCVKALRICRECWVDHGVGAAVQAMMGVPDDMHLKTIILPEPKPQGADSTGATDAPAESAPSASGSEPPQD